MMIDSFGETLSLLMLAGARLAVAAWVMPVFSQSAMPATVRNSLCVVLGLLVISQPGVIDLAALTPAALGMIIVREVVIGFLIGFLFAICILAFQIAGQLIDAKAGTMMGQLTDAFAGSGLSLAASLLNQWALVMFVSLGGLMWFVGLIMESFVLLPIRAEVPSLGVFAARLVTLEFSRLMALALAIAAPAMILLFAIEFGLGLMNRFAQALNAYQLAMGLKAWAVSAILALVLTGYVGVLAREMAGSSKLTRRAVEDGRLLGPGAEGGR